ncbi:DEAD/DEAH box helicase [Nocardiopsis sp. CNT312]|uniref:DEAD/DEAH box helicase n=1 Tax=Nocardiopsis sp. CNT312 TaxID=1137268 RepID=UPI00048DD84C|nr:DEAD/DEAH box helicase [Nocardiopsis sp. CNT312]
MHVIEAFWAADRLRVWGLDSARPPVTASRKRFRPHPYALDRTALAEAIGLPEPAVPGPGTALLHLPGTPRHPVPPPELAAMEGTPRYRPDQVVLRPWEVPVLDLSGPDALHLLRRAHTHPGSRSLPHLAALLEAAEALVDTRRTIPRLLEESVSVSDGMFSTAVPRARWRPLLDPAAMAWLRAHVRALPHAARAHHEPDLDAAEAGADAMSDTLEALCALTDLVARERLAHHTVDLPGHPRVQHLWLAALTGPDGDLRHSGPLTGRGADRLVDDLGEWFTAAHRFAGAIRLTFRLVEPAPAADGEDEDLGTDDQETGTGEAPEEGVARGLHIPGEEPWRLQIWVQSVEEPSLMVPLDGLREGEGADWLPRDPAEPVDRALAQAARACPLLVRALAPERPGTLELTPDEACDVLARHAHALHEAGFGVLLPPWVGEVGVGTRLTLSEHRTDRPDTGTGIGRTLVDFHYRAAVGGVALTAAELAELARLKRPLVRLRDEWARLDPAQLRRAAAYLSGRESGTVPVGEALRMALVPEPDAPELTAVDAGGDLGALLAGRAEQVFAPMAEPPGFNTELRPYQRRGAAWLRYLDRLGLGAVLADDMGLGKTVQLLALMADERTGDQARPAPTLLVCPTSVVGNWRKEAARFLPKLRVHLHHGANRPKGEDIAATAAENDLVVTTYGVALRDREELSALTWARVVCDEAQNIKNSRTKQAQAIRAVPAPSRIALTGTPVENHLGELWSILDFANPGLLGRREAFEKGIAADVGRELATDGNTGAAAALRRVTAPFVLRRLKTDTSIISDLPAKQEMRTWCTLTPEQASLYKATVDEMTALVDEATGIRRKGLVLATMTKLKQVCNHPAHLLGDGSRLSGRSGKLAQLEQLLAEMAVEGDKVLCFTQYTEFGSRLAPYLEGKLGMPVLWLHGGTPRRRREAMIERFQSSDEPLLFLLSLKAAGSGLNLTAARQVVHFDRWWNPAVEDQATDRAFRIGQRRNVQVRKMVCVGTLEERVDEMIEHKKNLAEAVVGTGEDWLGEMSVAELREVVRLAPEAVA